MFALRRYLLLSNLVASSKAGDMLKLGNYIMGKWMQAEGDGQTLHHAVTGAPIYQASTKGVDFASVLDYARKKGNPALRRMTFHERGRLLKALAMHLKDHVEQFYKIS